MASYKSNMPKVQATLYSASDAGLIAAAQVIVNEVKKRLRGGYTSGDFVTGNNINKVTRSDPFTDTDGMRAINIGSSQSDPAYPLFWELGHFNIFLRRFVRVEVWRPALVNMSAQAAQAYARAFKRAMGDQ